ncbi:hypothetical protein [Streptomyces aquilus]|uniref:hypothetical protein n=1 Tax=Streptomyces aquilus TaxID=2548456 RepID=UPI0036A2BE7F
MGTSLTPEFWERFILLLFAAMGLTFALAALFDELWLRRVNRRTHRPPTEPRHTPPRTGRTDHRTSVSC